MWQKLSPDAPFIQHMTDNSHSTLNIEHVPINLLIIKVTHCDLRDEINIISSFFPHLILQEIVTFVQIWFCCFHSFEICFRLNLFLRNFASLKLCNSRSSSSCHSSMVSTAGCYRGGPGFKSEQGQEFINFWLKRKFNNLNLNTIILWVYELTGLV